MEHLTESPAEPGQSSGPSHGSEDSGTSHRPNQQTVDVDPSVEAGERFLQNLREKCGADYARFIRAADELIANAPANLTRQQLGVLRVKVKSYNDLAKTALAGLRAGRDLKDYQPADRNKPIVTA